MYIEFTDLLIFLAVFLVLGSLFVVGAYAVVSMTNFIKVVKKVNKILEDNTGYINQTLKELPETVQNINQMSLSVKQNVDKAGETIGTIGEAVSEAAATVGENTEGVVSIIQTAASVAKTVIGFFTSKEKE